MVGAVILITIAFITACMGLVVWLGASDNEQALRGLTLLMIAATTLSAGLIIDGVRFYAEKISTQLAWASKRASYFGKTPETETSTQPLKTLNGNKSIVRYHIFGIDQETKQETELVVQAVDKTAALRTGEKAGLTVTRVEQVQA